MFFADRRPLFDWPYPNMRLLNRKQELELSNVQLDDEATFSCKATNPAGRDKQDFNLQVHCE